MKHVIIIGGGISGLSAGIYCRKNGIDCTIIEKNSFCGGNLTGWTRNGCYIDNCFHWLVGTAPCTSLYGIWKEIGLIKNHSELYQASVFYESELGGEHIAFSRYPELTRLNMSLLSPKDTVEIDRFIDGVEAAADFMCHKNISPNLLSAYGRYRRITLAQLGEKFVHPLLKIAFSDYIPGNFSAIALVWAYGAFACGNAMIPLGGSRNAALRVENRFKELGGTIRYSTEAKKIVTNGNSALGVITAHNEFIRADAVICCTDPSVTFGKLLPAERMPRPFAALYNNQERAPRFSSFQAAFVCNSQKLPRFGTKVVPFKDDELKRAGRMVIREYSYEPNFSPETQTVLQTMIFLNTEECEEWITLAQKNAEYTARKENHVNNIISTLKSVFPTLDHNDISYLDSWTPASYKRYFSSDHGEYMAFSLTPKTPLKRYPCELRGLNNVFMATQWQCSPGGLPNAARSGKQVATKLKRLLGS